MATMSLFYGIVVLMYNEANGRHHLPRVHARFGEFECAVDFDGNVLGGYLPPKKLALLKAWIILHRDDLDADWKLACDGLPILKIEPLR